MDEFILVITLDNSYLSQQKWDAGFYRVLGQLWKPGDQLPRKYSRAKLPEAPELLNVYQAWLKDYKDYYKAKKKLNNGFALYQDCDEDFDMEDEDVIQVSIKDLEQKLKDSSDRLKSKVTDWFKYPDFLELELQIRADLPDKQQPIQVIFETEDEQVKRLPLDNWQFFHNYPQAQLSLSLLTYNRIYPVISNRKKIRFLLILGNSTEIDVPEFKRQLDKIQSKEQQAEIVLLPQPSKKEFFDTLYNEEGWDIVIFAGHGKTENKQGIININEEKENNTITMLELKNSLEKAISKGLKLAIFNSCDGLGLGKDLAALNIPEIILFKEPVPQEVAKEFFRNFLDAFIFKKTSLYLAVHEATKKLQSLENEGYLCATMLPVLYHNPSQEPLSWNRLNKYKINNTYPSKQLEGETIFDFFKKAPFSLRNNIPIQTFQKIVNRKTEDFVGREYIFDEIDRYVNDDEQFKSGYIVVLGEPGIGKSAMMAQLVKQKEFVHHFNTENVYSTEQFWANICSQLILKYGLEYSDLPSPERDSPESNFQEEQKEEQKRNMNNENQRIKKYRMFFEEELISQITEKEKTVIILIDALDEAEEKLIQDRSNLLFLPKSLPDGIFFLITARPDKNYSLFVDNRRNIEMDDRDPRNINDVRRYVQEFLNKYREQMLSQIEKWGINDEEFIETNNMLKSVM